jgi:hypothetical protein
MLEAAVEDRRTSHGRGIGNSREEEGHGAVRKRCGAAPWRGWTSSPSAGGGCVLAVRLGRGWSLKATA